MKRNAKNIIWSLLFISSPINCFANCILDPFNYYLVTNNKKSLLLESKNFRYTNCAKKDLKKISNIFLHEKFNSKNLQILNTEYDIIFIENFIKKKLNLSDQFKVKVSGNKKNFIYNSDANFKFVINKNTKTCLVKLEAPKKKITLKFKYKILQKVTAFKLKRESFDLNSYTVNSFKEIKFWTEHPDHIFEDISHLKFYKFTNKLNINEILKKKHLRKKNIVKRGQLVTVLYEKKNIKLELKGIAQNSGRFDDLITIKNTTNNKTFLAHVSDFNSVKVKF